MGQRPAAKDYHCSECMSSFQQLMSLILYHQQYTGNRQGSPACLSCSKAFQWVSDFSPHLVSPDCGWAFNKNHYLTVHMQSYSWAQVSLHIAMPSALQGCSILWGLKPEEKNWPGISNDTIWFSLYLCAWPNIGPSIWAGLQESVFVYHSNGKKLPLC